jgi:hypothetical protein
VSPFKLKRCSSGGPDWLEERLAPQAVDAVALAFAKKRCSIIC